MNINVPHTSRCSWKNETTLNKVNDLISKSKHGTPSFQSTLGLIQKENILKLALQSLISLLMAILGDPGETKEDIEAAINMVEAAERALQKLEDKLKGMGGNYTALFKSLKSTIQYFIKGLKTRLKSAKTRDDVAEGKEGSTPEDKTDQLLKNQKALNRISNLRLHDSIILSGSDSLSFPDWTSTVPGQRIDIKEIF